MKGINMALDLFRDLAHQAEDEVVLQACLDVLTLANVHFLLRNPGTPLLYDPAVYLQLGFMPPPGLHGSGVYYQLEPSGEENFDSIPKVLRNGSGDCDDLSAFRAAEARVRFGDENARPCFVGAMTAPDYILYHVMVRRGDGIIEDPSLILGMGDTAESIREEAHATASGLIEAFAPDVSVQAWPKSDAAFTWARNRNRRRA